MSPKTKQEGDERVISRAQLRKCDGEGGRPKYVAFEGVVYDVTACPKWRGDLHEGMHWPGQDLTEAIEEAPHRADVFHRPCVRRVGILENA